jgi:V8-like Glu-specific endopeptidase
MNRTAFVLSALLSIASSALYGTGREIGINLLTHEQTLAQWTPDVMRDATPMEAVADVPLGPLPSSAKSLEAEVVLVPHPPLLDVPPDPDNLLFDPMPRFSARAKKPAVAAPFSSSRLIPLDADRSYPYRTVGLLLFRKQDDTVFSCSASIVSQRLVLTAGHCVHDGSGQLGGYYHGFVFIPAFRDGNAPFQAWTYSSVFTTNSWYTGKGKVPNSSDFGILEMNDSQAGDRIGAILGWLGVLANRLSPNHVLSLGYPSNIDGGMKMHQAASQSIGSTGLNTIAYGSDMEHGSSGGPWVQNFGEAGVGQARAFNYIVGVTSFGVDGSGRASSSTPDVQVINMINVMCGHRAGNCS